MTAAEQIRALIRTELSYNVKKGDHIAGARRSILGQCLAIVEAEEAKRTEAIKAMVEALAWIENQEPATQEYTILTEICGNARDALNLARAAGLTEDAT